MLDANAPEAEAKAVLRALSAPVARVTSSEILCAKAVETVCRLVEAALDSEVIAPLISLSADWKALTISASELSATASTLLRTLSTRVLTAARSPASEPETDAIVDRISESA